MCIRDSDSANLARGTRPGAIGEADRLLGDWFEVSRYRGRIAEFQFVTDLGEDSTKHFNGAPLAVLQEGLSGRGGKNPQVLDRVSKEVLNDYETSPGYLDTFVETLTRQQNDGRKVVAVLMPVESTYVSVHPLSLIHI